MKVKITTKGGDTQHDLSDIRELESCIKRIQRLIKNEVEFKIWEIKETENVIYNHNLNYH
ncbi:hypothetical protein LCGC14_2243520, partial [marine sediment metagenome]